MGEIARVLAPGGRLLSIEPLSGDFDRRNGAGWSKRLGLQWSM